MVWVDKPGKTLKPVKLNGQCWNKSQWRYCPYWHVRTDPDTKQIIAYWCSLYDKEKPGGYTSLDECNEEWGLSYTPNL